MMLDIDYILSKESGNGAFRDLATMLLIREAELLIAYEAGKQTFGTPIHLAIGQEAIAVGVAKSLQETDSIFGNHRSHAHFISSGATLKSLFSEILGRKSGASGGKGGSMHLTSPSTGLIGTMPIVAGTIPIAVGAALSKRRLNNKEIAVIYFGDGAAEEGVFHESLNLAKVLKLPILFICENNIFSSHLHIEERQPSAEISRFAVAHKINHFSVDGNAIEKVTEIAAQAVKYCREEREPVMIEAHTYRLFGHVGFQKDEKVGLRRMEELPYWEERDPILREIERVTQGKNDLKGNVQDLNAEIKKFVASTWKESLQEEYPASQDLTRNVYYEGTK